MNYLPHITLVGWETRNWRHRNRALVWCKDYGFAPLTKHVFFGELYAKERKEMEAKFKSLFTGKTEKSFFVTMCKACFNESMVDFPVKMNVADMCRFELVQMPENP